MESQKKPLQRRCGHGEGSIHKRADGRRYATIDLGFKDGKRQRTSVCGHTRREVQEKLDELRLQHRQGIPVAPRRELLGASLDRWHATLKPRPQGPLQSDDAQRLRRRDPGTSEAASRPGARERSKR
jgi:hypothetical protein